MTRAENWYDSEEHPISLAEWLTYIESDPEMRLDGYAEATPKGSKVAFRIESEGLAVWTAYSGHGKDGNMAWFSYGDGEVYVKNPDDEILGKMRKIARALGAKVQGDEGELFD